MRSKKTAEKGKKGGSKKKYPEPKKGNAARGGGHQFHLKSIQNSREKNGKHPKQRWKG